MAVRNFVNFAGCFGAIFLVLVVVPFAYDVFAGIALVLFVIRHAEWMMTRTRRYFLQKRVSSRNKAVLITGCDSGFGHMLAMRMDKLGYHVFAACLDCSGAGAQSLANCCSSKLLTLPLDVTSDKSVASAVEFVENNLGENELWAVVNNAGIAQGGEIDWTSLEDFRNVYEVNAFGMVRVTKAFLHLLQKSKGRVVNNTSACGTMTCPGYVGYCMSKSAAVAFTTGLRIEMVKWGVKSISVEAFFYKTHISNVEYNIKVVENTWNKASNEMKEKYGKQYLEDFKNSTSKILNKSSHKTHEVIYCFEDAITAVDPLSTYFPCHLFFKMGIKMFKQLPSIVLETYQYYQMPYSVKPAALMKKAVKNGTNGVSKSCLSGESDCMFGQTVENGSRKDK